MFRMSFVLVRELKKMINFKFHGHGHIPYLLGINPIENGYCWIVTMAANKLEIEGKYMNFPMATLKLTFDEVNMAKNL